VVTDVAALGDGILVGTRDGAYVVNAGGTQRVDPPGPCGNFVTGITRYNGDLVIGTFDHGACRLHGGVWESIGTPSPMVNDVLAVPGGKGQGETLWMATAEGVVELRPDGTSTVIGEVPDNTPRHAPGLNSNGANSLMWDGAKLWIADVLGPTSVATDNAGAASWNRYRWSVSGHSYQTVASCGGAVFAGSEDDGLAVQGLKLGAPNGRSDWRHVNALDELPEDWIMATICAGKRAAWVGTYRHGVGRLDAHGWTAIPGLESAWVQSLAADGDTLWVGTADGVYRVSGAHGDASQARVGRVTADDAWTLYVEPGVLWVGTRTGLRGYATESAQATENGTP
jgi:ligand-binding sensor domain-containing protein